MNHLFMFFVSVALFASSVFAVDVTFEDHIPVYEKICDGLYAGKGKTSNGEEIYFGYELITEENIGDLKGYLAATNHFLNMNNGILMTLLIWLQQGKVVSYDLFKSFTGFEKGEHDNFISMLKQIGFDKGENTGGVLATCSGSNHMTTRVNESYFAYISKKPIVAPRNFGGLTEESTLKEYLAVNTDLIMMVSSTPTQGLPCSSTIGIFRHMQSCFDRGAYRNISMNLHGWIAVITKEVLGKKYIRIRPTPAMANVIEKKLTRKKDYYTDRDANELKILMNNEDIQFTRYNILVDSLVLFF